MSFGKKVVQRYVYSGNIASSLPKEQPKKTQNPEHASIAEEKGFFIRKLDDGSYEIYLFQEKYSSGEALSLCCILVWHKMVEEMRNERD